MTIEVYKQRKSDLDKEIRPIKKRKQARTLINKELKNLEKKLNEVENKYDEYVLKNTWLPDNEKSIVSSYIEDARKWVNEKREVYDSTAINQDLDIKKEDILGKIAHLDDKLKKLKAV